MLEALTGTSHQQNVRRALDLFEQALAETYGEKTAARGTGGTRHRVMEDAYSGSAFIQIDSDILKGVPKAQWGAAVRDEMKRRYPNGVKLGGWTIAVNADSRAEFTASKNSRWLKSNDSQTYGDKLRSIANLEEIVNIADNVRNEDPSHPRKDGYKSFNRANVLIRVGGNGYRAEVITAINAKTNEIFYDIINLTPTKIKEERSKSTSAKPLSSERDHSSAQSITRGSQNVNGRLSTDPNASTVITNANGDTVAVQHKGRTAFSLGTYRDEGRDILIDYTDIKADRSPRRRAEPDAAIGFLDHVYALCCELASGKGEYTSFTQGRLGQTAEFSIIRTGKCRQKCRLPCAYAYGLPSICQYTGF